MNINLIGKFFLLFLIIFESKGNLFAESKNNKQKTSRISSELFNLTINRNNFTQNLKQKKRRKGAGSSHGNGPEGAKEMSVDIYVGPAMNLAFGNFFLAQNAYYETSSTLYPASVVNTDFISFTAGAQFRYSPFLKNDPTIGLLGFGIGVAYLQRGYKSEFKNQNLTLEYIDKTGINESIKANYLSTNLFIRYGNKLFFEIGPSLDWLISGTLKSELTRATSGTKAYNGAFETGETKPDQDLKSDYLTSGGLGWTAGFGGLFTPMFGARFHTTYNPAFLKEGANLTNLQFSIQATITIN